MMRFTRPLFMTLPCLMIFAGCVVSRPEIIGHTAKITGLIPCAGSAEAADAMDSNSFAGAVGAEGQGAAASANFRQLNASGGIWLQNGWTVRFTGSQDIGYLDYTSIYVEAVPKDQQQYRGDMCWLKTDDIQTWVDQGDLKYPIGSSS
ncbi:MAG TPA: hypothetical protein VMW12_02570, partial [Candidatus Dormibacteraeota bacterium]|nr:hypothetical protein [Candidatus Dormibacteraeota bacterium]